MKKSYFARGLVALVVVTTVAPGYAPAANCARAEDSATSLAPALNRLRQQPEAPFLHHLTIDNDLSPSTMFRVPQVEVGSLWIDVGQTLQRVADEDAHALTGNIAGVERVDVFIKRFLS